MTVLESLKAAIETLKPVSFTYQNNFERMGNPYAIFILQTNNTTKVHIVQTSGYTSSGELNKFKQFNIEQLANIQILEDQPSFIPNHPDYRPESDYYSNVIAKV